MNNFILPIIALIGTMILSRSITEKAMRFLSDEQKEQLTEMYRSQRKVGMIAILVIVGLYFALMELQSVPTVTITIIYVALVIVFIGAQGVLANKKLKALEFPAEFVKAHIQSTVFRALGVVLFIVLLVTG